MRELHRMWRFHLILQVYYLWHSFVHASMYREGGGDAPGYTIVQTHNDSSILRNHPLLSHHCAELLREGSHTPVPKQEHISKLVLESVMPWMQSKLLKINGASTAPPALCNSVERSLLEPGANVYLLLYRNKQMTSTHAASSKVNNNIMPSCKTNGKNPGGKCVKWRCKMVEALHLCLGCLFQAGCAETVLWQAWLLEFSISPSHCQRACLICSSISSPLQHTDQLFLLDEVTSRK